MGKTLLNYFAGFESSEIAQFYIQSEIPESKEFCSRYYRFTDIDALKSIFMLKKYGRVFDVKKDITVETGAKKIKTSKKMFLNRSAAVYFARNIIWRFSHWFTKDLRKWLIEFNPDIIFFSSGDYAFMYNIACKIARYLKRPLVISCMDDYYVYSVNGKTLLGKIEHKLYMGAVKRAMKQASAIVPICESMANIYSKMFNRPTFVMHTPAPTVKLNFNKDARNIAYLGNVGLGRFEQLIEMGNALQKIDCSEGPKVIDVYSNIKNEDIRKKLMNSAGIRLHEAIPEEYVRKVMENSMAVVHTESFSEDLKERVKYSVSTKIAESTMYGPCLLAYGPEGIASIDYLKQYHAAYIITSKDELISRLKEFIDNKKMREEIISNARKLAKKNHDISAVSTSFKIFLEETVNSYYKNSD